MADARKVIFLKKAFLALGITLSILLGSVYQVGASATDGTIDATNKYAWDDQSGWINFGTSAGDVHVLADKLTGYAWSTNNGWIKLDPTSSGVKNDGTGALSGYAWGAQLGWINFSGVTIDANGVFHGSATGTQAGTLTFDCTHCKVSTDWRASTTTPVTPVTPTPPTNNSSPITTTTSAATGSTAKTTTSAATNPPPAVTPDKTDEAIRPAQLFDISLALDEKQFSSVKDLVARVSFTSFGTEATPVNMTFVVYNSKNVEVYRTTDTTTVETSTVYTKKFNNLHLSDGKYKIALKTLYNTNVSDTFTQNFTIKSSSAASATTWLAAAVVIVLLLVVLSKKRHTAKKSRKTDTVHHLR